MSFNFRADSIELDVIDGFMFGCVTYHYSTPYDMEVFLEKYLNIVDEQLGLDYTIFDEEYGKLEIVYSLESEEDFEDLKCLLEV